MEVVANITPSALREKIRSGEFSDNTSGLAPGFVQCNIVILPSQWAADFLRFCQANPRPCPLIACSSSPGDTGLAKLGNIDIRRDIPSYRVFRDGVFDVECGDIMDLWTEDLVTFALGCSFSFEEALMEAGLDVRNISEKVNVPMFRSNIPCESAGPFSGDMVVSMRPFLPADAIRAIQVCSRFPAVHGAPVHLGDPGAIGIADINAPDYGDPVNIRTGELPLFWACGVTPQVALENAAPPFAITHSPGCMLVTDMRNAELAIL
ncbi:putative hydro-lyase [Congregibacter brevis]|uniref:Putative hydro-lyase R0137_13045 n=1 Tax=Congregibacter brevis TaxID=3081201 RepID=A0ABZ0IBH0_9GAMM|nr:putative hydro-lyase [Congregibacter sp. IMCC45268]